MSAVSSMRASISALSIRRPACPCRSSRIIIHEVRKMSCAVCITSWRHRPRANWCASLWVRSLTLRWIFAGIRRVSGNGRGSCCRQKTSGNSGFRLVSPTVSWCSVSAPNSFTRPRIITLRRWNAASAGMTRIWGSTGRCPERPCCRPRMKKGLPSRIVRARCRERMA